MNVEASSSGPVTAPASNLRQLSSSRNSRGSVFNTSIQRTRSLDDIMDIQTPLRRPTEHYTRVGERSLHSCDSCSSLNDGGETYDHGKSFERQDTGYSCDDPKTERQRTEFTCYVPTRRNTIAGQNEPIRYYVPSRGPEQRDAWFPRLVLQTKDPKAPQYGASAISPLITSFGLKTKDVQLDSPRVDSKASEQQSSDRPASSLARPDTEVSAVSPRQTMIKVARQETQFSCDTSQLESRRASQPKSSTRSANLSSSSALVTPEPQQPQGDAGRKQTQFSCDPSSSAKSESVVQSHTSESIVEASANLDTQQPETRVERTVTEFSCYEPDLSVSQKPTVAETQAEPTNLDVSRLETRFDRTETDFSCYVPDIATSRKSVVQARVKSANLELSQLGTRVMRKETDFSCYDPDVPESLDPSPVRVPSAIKDTEYSYTPDLTESLKASLPGTQFVRTETEFSCYPGTSISRASNGPAGGVQVPILDPEHLSSNLQFSYGTNQTTFQSPPSREHEATLQTTITGGSKVMQQAATDASSGFDFQLSTETGNAFGQFATEFNPLPLVSRQDVTVRQPAVQETSRQTFSFPSIPQMVSAVTSKAIESIPLPGIYSGSVEQEISSQYTSTVGPQRARVSFQVPPEDLKLETDFISQVHSGNLPRNSDLLSDMSSKTESNVLKTEAAQVSAISKRLPEIGQLESTASQAVPRASFIRLQSVPEEPPTAQLPTRIPSKSRSSIFRNFSQRDPARKGSNQLRNVASDSALKETARAPSLLAVSRKAVATRPVITTTEASRSRPSDADLPETPALASEAEPAERVKPPSLRSGSSKRSGASRHALLSTSLGTFTPIDMGLPIPPMLSSDLASASGVGSGMESLTVKLKHTESLSPTGMPNVSSLPMRRIVDSTVLVSTGTNAQNSAAQQTVVPSYMDLFHSRKAEQINKSRALEAQRVSAEVLENLDVNAEVLLNQEQQVRLSFRQWLLERQVRISFRQWLAERRSLATEFRNDLNLAQSITEITVLQQPQLNAQVEERSEMRMDEVITNQLADARQVIGSILQPEARRSNLLSAKLPSILDSAQASATTFEQRTLQVAVQPENTFVIQTGETTRTQISSQVATSDSALRYEAENVNSLSTKLESDRELVTDTELSADSQASQRDTSFTSTIEINTEVFRSQVSDVEQVTDSVMEYQTGRNLFSTELSSDSPVREQNLPQLAYMNMGSLPAVGTETISQNMDVSMPGAIALPSLHSRVVAVPGQQQKATISVSETSSELKDMLTSPVLATERNAANLTVNFPDSAYKSSASSVTLPQTADCTVIRPPSESQGMMPVPALSTQRDVVDLAIEIPGPTYTSESMVVTLPNLDVLLNSGLVRSRDEEAFTAMEPIMVDLRRREPPESRSMSNRLRSPTTAAPSELPTLFAESSDEVKISRSQANQSSMVSQSYSEPLVANRSNTLTSVQLDALIEQTLARTEPREQSSSGDASRLRIGGLDLEQQIMPPSEPTNQSATSSNPQINEALSMPGNTVPPNLLTSNELDELIAQTLARTESAEQSSAVDTSRLRITETNLEEQISSPRSKSQVPNFSRPQPNGTPSRTGVIVESTLLISTRSGDLIEQALARTESSEQSSSERSRLQVNDSNSERQSLPSPGFASQVPVFSTRQTNEMPSPSAGMVHSGLLASAQVDELTKQSSARSVASTQCASREFANNLQGQDIAATVPLPQTPKTQTWNDQDRPAVTTSNDFEESTRAFLSTGSFLANGSPPLRTMKSESGIDKYSSLSSRSNSDLQILEGIGLAVPVTRTQSPGGKNISQRRSAEFSTSVQDGPVSDDLKTEIRKILLWQPSRKDEPSAAASKLWGGTVEAAPTQRPAVLAKDTSQQAVFDSTSTSQLTSQSKVVNVSNLSKPEHESLPIATEIISIGTVIASSPRTSGTAFASGRRPTIVKRVSWKPEDVGLISKSMKIGTASSTAEIPQDRIEPATVPLPRTTGNTPSRSRNVSESQPDTVNISSPSIIDKKVSVLDIASSAGRSLWDLLQPANVPLPRTRGNTLATGQVTPVIRNGSQTRTDIDSTSLPPKVDDNLPAASMSSVIGKALRDFTDPAKVALPRTTGNTAAATRNASQSQLEMPATSFPTMIEDEATGQPNPPSVTKETGNLPFETTGPASSAMWNISQLKSRLSEISLPTDIDNTASANQDSSSPFQATMASLQEITSDQAIERVNAFLRAEATTEASVNMPVPMPSLSSQEIRPADVPLPISRTSTRAVTRNPPQSRIDITGISSSGVMNDSGSGVHKVISATVEASSVPLPKTTGNTPVATRNASVQETWATEGSLPLSLRSAPAEYRNITVQNLQYADTPSRTIPINELETSQYASETRIRPESLPLPASRDNTPAATRNVSIWDFQPTAVPLPASAVNSPVMSRHASQTQTIPVAVSLPSSRNVMLPVTWTDSHSIRATEIPLPISKDNTPVRTWDVSLQDARSEDVPLPPSQSDKPAMVRDDSISSTRAINIPLPISTGSTPVRTWDIPPPGTRPAGVPLPLGKDNTQVSSRSASIQNALAIGLPLPISKDTTPTRTWDVSVRDARAVEIFSLPSKSNAPITAQSSLIQETRPSEIPLPVSKNNTPAGTWNVFMQNSELVEMPLPPSNVEASVNVRAPSQSLSGPETIPLPPSKRNTPVATWDISSRPEPGSIPLPSSQYSPTVVSRNFSLKQPLPSPASKDDETAVTLNPSQEQAGLLEPAVIPLPAGKDDSPSASWNISPGRVEPVAVPLPASRYGSARATRNPSQTRTELDDFGLPVFSGELVSKNLLNTYRDSGKATEPASIPLPESKGPTPVATRKSSSNRNRSSTVGIMALPAVRKVSGDPAVTSDVNIEYWGFVPAVVDKDQSVLQGAVEGAFQETVRKVIQDGIVTTDATATGTSLVYRELIAESLDEAAKTANEYLRRSIHEQSLAPVSYDLPSQEQNFEEIIIESQNAVEEVDKSDTILKIRSQANEDRRASQKEDAEVKVVQEQESSPVKSITVRNIPDPRSYAPSQYSVNQSAQDSVSTGGAGVNKVPVEEYERLASTYRLDEPSGEPAANESESALWKAWNALSGSRQNSYVPIPTRRSSAETQVRTRKLSSKISPTQISRVPTGTAYRNLSLGSIKERPRESGSFDFDQYDELIPDEVSGNGSSIAVPSPTIKRRRTVHWLRELMSSTEPYAMRLTALPPRIERDRLELQRSETAPAKPVERLFLGATPKPALQSAQAVEMEVYSKTVSDVEQLLSQALVLAKQAADSDKAEVIPVLENAALVLRNGRPDLNMSQREFSRQKWRRSDFVSDSFEERGAGSADESNRSTYSEDRFSIGDDSDGEREQLIYHRSPLQSDDEVDVEDRIVTVDPNASPRKSWSGWPPTGRAATPFPPSSVLASTTSNEAGEPDGFLAQEEFLQRSLQSFGNAPVIDEIDVIDVIEPAKLEKAESIPILVHPGSVHQARTHLAEEHALLEASSEDAQDVDAFLLAKDDDNVDSDSLAQIEEIRKQSVPKPPRAQTGPEGRPKTLPDKREVRNFIKEYSQPPIAPRHSSLKLRAMAQSAAERTQSAAHTIPARTKPIRTTNIFVRPRGNKAKAVMIQEQTSVQKSSGTALGKSSPVGSSQLSLDGPPEGEIDLGVPQPSVLQNEVSEGIHRRVGGYPAESSEDRRQAARGEGHEGIPEDKVVESHELKELPIGGNLPTTRRYARNKKLEDLNLRGKSHVSLKEHHRFSLGRSKKRQPIARDWSRNRKRFAASVSCISTALIGILIGIYAGQVPSIQYYLADQHHLSILGNVFLFIGLSIPTIFLWPLPLLHGRKPYILASMSIAMPLLFPQAVVVSSIRSPYVSYYYVGLLLPRAVMGFVLGLANMNFQATLLDLFGASLRSGNPHGEDIDEFDVRRHGGGMGVWLGLWTWCYIGSIGLGFTVGAILINYLAPSWGMYICIIILLFISVLNVLTPEVRRGAYRRSVAEVKTAEGISRRVARGEVMMHRVQTGPKWFGQELYHGMMLSVEMLRQPGFLVMATYQAWIYGQVVLLIVLLGSLISNSYRFKSPYVGLSVAAIPIGAALAIPFERASIFSRARTQIARTNSNTFETRINWTSHIVRRAIFTLSLPLMGLGYTLSSYGRPVPFIIPILFSAAFGFLSNMTIAECIGITMETWDTSDLQPGMTGRPRRNSGEDSSGKRTNYSSFPRVASAFGITQGLGFLIAAVATGVGGVATRGLGQQAATGVMAGILIVLTLLFFAVLVRWQDVQIIPNAKTGEMDLYLAQRRLTAMRPPDAPEVEEPWRPTIIGNPKSKTRRMSIIELGSMTRWSEIRRKNRLYDETVAHPDRAVLHQAHVRLQEKQQHVVRSVHGSLRSAHGSLRGRLSREASQEGGSRRAKGKERQREAKSDESV